MVCESELEDNPRDLASGFSSVHTQTPYNYFYCPSMHLHFVHCDIFDVKHRNINKMSKNVILSNTSVAKEKGANKLRVHVDANVDVFSPRRSW